MSRRDHRETITLTNDLAEIRRLARLVETFCAPLPATPKDLAALQLVLEEAVTNIIEHGYTDGGPHTFTIVLDATTPDRVIVTVIDDAPAYDPLARPEVDVSVPLDQRPVGGLGVHLMKRLSHAARYERRDGRNILIFEHVLGRAS